MKYYDEAGELQYGVKVAAKPLRVELIEGDYHVVWFCINGSMKTVGWSRPTNKPWSQLTNKPWTISFTRQQDSREFNVKLCFPNEQREYTLKYEDTIANGLRLTKKLTAKYEGDPDAMISYSHGRDDQNHHFLRFFAAPEILLVAKRTEPKGQCPGLSKNEALIFSCGTTLDDFILPVKVDEDEDMRVEDKDMSLDQLLQKFEDNRSGTLSAYKEIRARSNQIDYHYTKTENSLQLLMQTMRELMQTMRDAS